MTSRMTAWWAGLASALTLVGIFVYAMMVHYRAIDVAYLVFALPRIGVISLVVAALAHVLAAHLSSSWRSLLFGATAGFLGGATYVAAVT